MHIRPGPIQTPHSLNQRKPCMWACLVALLVIGSVKSVSLAELSTKPATKPAAKSFTDTFVAPKPRLEISYDKNSQRLSVNNHEPGPYTMTFRFPTFENTAIDCDNPCTRVVYPGKHDVLQYRKINSQLPWHHRYHYDYRRGDYRTKVNLKQVYQLPYAKGANYKMGQAYNGDFTHTGDSRYALDFALPLGTPIHAARGGLVIWTVDQFTQAGVSPEFKGKDNRIEILHNDGSVALYGHLQRKGVKVKAGQQVISGQFLGYSGHTGFSGAPHLHFQVAHPVNGERTLTVPTLFQTSKGLEILKRGQAYLRP